MATGAALLACVALLAGLTLGAAGAVSTMATVGCVSGTLLAIALLWHGLRSSKAASDRVPLEIPVGVPQDHALLTARLLALETQLEHAPVALFHVEHLSDGHAVAPLNANARRLLAPGRAVDADELCQRLAEVPDGRRCVIDFDTERGNERALATATSMTINGQPQRLVALVPVENELEAEAMHAWEKLVHVLTHEIMNSLTPVASLSHTAREMLAEIRVKLPGDIVKEIDVALDAIGRRADSLAHFVGEYRSLASVPAAQAEPIAIAELFARVSALVSPSWEERGGVTRFTVEPDSLAVMADPGQLEQALVNLLRNAAEATEGVAAPEVTVSAKLTRGGRLRIEVRDNGPGVKDDLIAHIFTPFFSTKSKGSGIGLSMVRQLIHRSGGSVRYAKSIGSGARFIITF